MPSEQVLEKGINPQYDESNSRNLWDPTVLSELHTDSIGEIDQYQEQGQGSKANPHKIAVES